MRRSSLLLGVLLLCLATAGMCAEGPAFDLAGPKVDVHVKRGDVTLPISEVSNLLPGDRLWIHPDLPASQSARFVLVVAFLRGATNPPPPDWFSRFETWNPDIRDEGVFVTVPEEAQQALIFLAPETGGDFNTLRNSVRARPGSFVRAAQDLQAASWERMRLQAYLNEVRVTSQTDPRTLRSRAEMAARSLGIKIDESCFDRPADQQGSCLSRNSEGLVLDDANAQSLVTQLTNGDTLNLVNEISSSTMGGGGMYSPYIGAIVDTARILASLHTAHFQYIPALALPTADTLNLRLNMPPSFRNPKSVVVVALPPLGRARPEPLHPVSPADDFCVQKPGLVLPAEGAPLVFATRLAHDLFLHIEARDGSKGHPVDLPLAADPAKGGLALVNPAPPLPEGELTGVVEGKWGFDDWKGPHYLLRASEPGQWSLDPGDESALVVGRDDALHLSGQNTLCVEKVEANLGDGGTTKLLWTSPHSDQLTLSVPMKHASPGAVTLSIYQYGLATPESISLRAYADAASLERFTLSAGDKNAILRGTRLDEVARAEFDGIAWAPGDLTRVSDLDQLALNTSESTAKLKPGKRYVATVHLLDGRKLKVPVTVDPPRPEAVLLSKGIQDDDPSHPAQVVFGSPDDLPVQSRLVFFLKSTTPSKFSRDEKVEVAGDGSSFTTTLDLAGGGLMLEDASTAVGTIEPLKKFGYSAFGPLRVRVISADGAAGDWLDLGTLVRLPGFKQLRCPRAQSHPCLLSGTNLFLAGSFSATPDFANATEVPVDFTGTELEVPHPVNGALYVKLRDDPATVQTLNMPVTPLPFRRLSATESRRDVNPAENAPDADAQPSDSSSAGASSGTDSDKTPSGAAASPAQTATPSSSSPVKTTSPSSVTAAPSNTKPAPASAAGSAAQAPASAAHK